MRAVYGQDAIPQLFKVLNCNRVLLTLAYQLTDRGTRVLTMALFRTRVRKAMHIARKEKCVLPLCSM